MIDAHFDKAQMREIKRALGGGGKALPRILASAVNETVKTTNSEIAKETDLALPQNKVRPPRAGGQNPISKWKWTKAVPARPQAVISFPFAPISLVHFRHRDTRKAGVRVKVFKGKGQETMRHAFAARAKGAMQIWTRWDKRIRRASGRLPLTKKVGPSIKGIVENKPSLRAIVARTGALLTKRLGQQIDRYLTRRR